MYLITYFMPVFITHWREMLEYLRIEKKWLCIGRWESARLKVKKYIPSQSMHLARVSTFDVICCDLKSWDPAHAATGSDEYIGLIYSCRDMRIGSIDFRHSFDRDIDTIEHECKDIESRDNIVPYNIGRDLTRCRAHTDTRTMEYSPSPYMYMTSIRWCIF